MKILEREPRKVQVMQTLTAECAVHPKFTWRIVWLLFEAKAHVCNREIEPRVAREFPRIGKKAIFRSIKRLVVVASIAIVGFDGTMLKLSVFIMY